MSENPIKKLIEEVDADTTLTDEAREATKARLSRLNDAHKSEMEKVKSAKQAELERQIEEIKAKAQSDTNTKSEDVVLKTQLNELTAKLKDMEEKELKTSVNNKLISAIAAGDFIDNDIIADAIRAKLVYSAEGAIVRDGGEDYTIEQYVEHYKTKKPHLVKAGGIPGNGGSNGQKNTPPASGLWAKNISTLTGAEKIKLAKEDPTRYREKVESEFGRK